MKTIRDPYWDNIKLALIFVVVLGHYILYAPYTKSNILCSAENLICIFHMPLFIFISGRFSKNELNKQNIISIFCLLETYAIFQLFNHFHSDIVEYRALRYFFKYPSAISWYLLTLIIYRTLFLFIPKNALRNYKILLPLLFVCSISIGYIPLSFEYSFQRTFTYLFFFYIGYITKNIDAKIVDRIKIKYCIFTFSFIFLLLLLNNKDYLSFIASARCYSETGTPFQRILLLLISTILGISFMRLCRILPMYFSQFGKNTLIIYFFHIFIVKAVAIYIPYLNSDLIMCILSSIITMIILILLCRNKYINYIVNPITKIMKV